MAHYVHISLTTFYLRPPPLPSSKHQLGHRQHERRHDQRHPAPEHGLVLEHAAVRVARVRLGRRGLDLVLDLFELEGLGEEGQGGVGGLEEGQEGGGEEDRLWGAGSGGVAGDGLAGVLGQSEGSGAG